MIEHTPGPWTFCNDTVMNLNMKDDICYINEHPLDDDRFSNGERGHANGNLLAASPELLECCRKSREALENAISLFGECPTARDIIEEITAAVEKAEGK
jgi:hypothetical protein